MKRLACSRSIRIGTTVLLLVAAAVTASAKDIIVALPDGKKAILHDDHTWQYYQQKPTYAFDFSTLSPDNVPAFLRSGIRADVSTLKTAVEMYLQGWRYRMPVPKSAQAAWGNFDRRTTWFYGYWYNVQNGGVSKGTPTVKENGTYTGDGQDLRNYYRNGGSPSTPTKLEWLLSQDGGTKPSP